MKPDNTTPTPENKPTGKLDKEYSLGEKAELTRQGLTHIHVDVALLRLAIKNKSIGIEGVDEFLATIEEIAYNLRGGQTEVVENNYPTFRDKNFETKLANNYLNGLGLSDPSLN